MFLHLNHMHDEEIEFFSYWAVTSYVKCHVCSYVLPSVIWNCVLVVMMMVMDEFTLSWHGVQGLQIIIIIIIDLYSTIRL